MTTFAATAVAALPLPPAVMVRWVRRRGTFVWCRSATGWCGLPGNRALRGRPGR